MSRRVFLDVGANKGQTLAAVLDASLAFDQIVCFEPIGHFWKQLKKLGDERVRIVRFGLWNLSCWRPLFEPESHGPSLWQKDQARSSTTELCRFHRASEWFETNVDSGDKVFLKLNCEGAECDILDDLLDSGEFRKVSFAMVDFDVRKISSQKHREQEIRSRLDREQIGFPRVAFSKQVMLGPTHEARIKNWLRTVEAAGSA